MAEPSDVDAWGAEFLSLFTIDELRFDATSASEQPTSFQAEWQEIATRQHRLRATAETENAALRRLALEQRQHAQAMARLVARAANSLTRVLSLPPSLADYRGPRADPYEQLMSLEGLVGLTDEVFAARAYQRRDLASLEDAVYNMREPTAGGVEVELQMSWALPFDVDAVATAFWRKPTRGSMIGNEVQRQEFYEDDDVTVGQFISTAREETALPLAHGQVAARRFAPRDGAHLSVSTFSACIFDGSTERAVVHSQEWMRFEPVHDRPDRTSSPSVSRVQWCRRVHVRPRDYDNMTPTERRKWNLAAVTGPMRHHMERSLQRKVQEAENWLLTASQSHRPKQRGLRLS